MSLLEDSWPVHIVCPDNISCLEIRTVQLGAALVAFLRISPCEVSPCTAARWAGQPFGRSCPVEPPVALQVGKPVKCQGDGGREEATWPLQKHGSVALLGSMRRYRGWDPMPGQHFSQRHVHLMNTLPTAYNSKYEALWSSIVKSLPTPVFHPVNACYRLKCISPVDLF